MKSPTLYSLSLENIFLFLKNLFIFICGCVCLRCCAQAFSSCGERGLLFVAVHRFLIVVPSLVAEHGL